MIKYILWDIDNTLLDFDIAEKASMLSGLKRLGIDKISEDSLEDYKKINDKYWKKLEKGEITRKKVLLGRFEEFFDKKGIDYDQSTVENFNDNFQKDLGINVAFHKNAKNVLEKLKENYKQYAITNGTKVAQEAKIENSGLDNILDGVFISEDLGVDKPNKEFFDIVLNQVGSKDPREYIVIGDSLTSDIKGANNAGIKCIWFNPKHKINEKDVSIDYSIHDLTKVIDILDDLSDW